MNYTTVTNPVWADAGQTLIDCIVTFNDIGTVPFTACATDSAEHGQEIFAQCVAGDFGPISAYTEPPPPPPPNYNALRRAAYAAESDPIFFMSQRGEATQQQWLDKVAEIKARWP